MSGDLEYPSIPGKPETYSPRYHRFAVERSKGLRCSVCGKVQDPDCIEGC